MQIIKSVLYFFTSPLIKGRYNSNISTKILIKIKIIIFGYILQLIPKGGCGLSQKSYGRLQQPSHSTLKQRRVQQFSLGKLGDQ